MLSASNLSYCIGNKSLLHDFNIEVRPGQFVALAGPNGAGKSTALRILCGELKPATGNVLLNGASLQTMPPKELAA